VQLRRKALGIGIALLWIVAGCHCQLEFASGFDFLRCDPHSAAANSHCNDDACRTVESGQALVTPPHTSWTLPLLTAWLAPSPVPVRPQSTLGRSSAAPPEFGSGWQFFQRTAPPARAPSIAS
jgi:1-acyl-sn-glycerol-3-phosphate acyltransferase